MSAEIPGASDELAGIYRRPGFPGTCQGLGEGACGLSGCPGRQMEAIGEGQPPSDTKLREGEGYCPTGQVMTPQGLVFNRAKPIVWSAHPTALAKPRVHPDTHRSRRVVNGPEI